jgi:hypothetical protein
LIPTGKYPVRQDWVVADAVERNRSPKPNSLRTGKFTGNFAKSGHEEAPVQRETPGPQAFLSRFPTQNNREKILNNREIPRFSREKTFVFAASGRDLFR